MLQVAVFLSKLGGCGGPRHDMVPFPCGGQKSTGGALGWWVPEDLLCNPHKPPHTRLSNNVCAPGRKLVGVSDVIVTSSARGGWSFEKSSSVENINFPSKRSFDWSYTLLRVNSIFGTKGSTTAIPNCILFKAEPL